MKFLHHILFAAMIGGILLPAGCGGKKTESGVGLEEPEHHEGEEQEVALSNDQYKIAGIETGKRNPSLQSVDALARGFGLELGELFEGVSE